MAQGNSGCLWPCDMVKESVWPYTHLGLWSNDDDDDGDEQKQEKPIWERSQAFRLFCFHVVKVFFRLGGARLICILFQGLSYVKL